MPGPDELGPLRFLLSAAHLTGPDDLPALVTEAGSRLGAAATLYVVDYDQIALVPLVEGHIPARAPLAIDRTLAGRAFAEVWPQESTDPNGATLWVPVLDGTDRLGVLQLTFGSPPDDTLRGEALSCASLLAELLLTRGQYGDAIQRARRRLPMTLPAEMQWTQLPPLTFATPRVAIAAVLVPTHEVAGDSFDYAVNDDRAHVAIVDAMGHGLEATLLSTVAIGALRNARRSGLTLVDSARSIDKHLGAHFGQDKFVTAVIGELELGTGTWRWVNAGHPPALIIRSGRVVKTLDSHVNPPLGLMWDLPEAGEERLQPGDRLLLHTDGVVEARDSQGRFFGTERLVDLIRRESAAGRPAPETLRRLNLAILSHQGGDLQDDATTLLIEWQGQDPDRMVVRRADG